MPSINVRLTEGQHEALRTLAFKERSSIQKVVIARLFGNGLAAEDPVVPRGAGGDAAAGARPGSSAASPSFRPDFKKGKQ